MVELLAGSDTKAFVNGLIHEGTQVQEGSILLSVATVSILQTRAEFDFGGSEYRTAQQEKIAPEKRSPDDRYGWWSLEPGVYLIRYNESFDLPDGYIGIVQPWWRSFINGVHHPTQVFFGKHSDFHMLLTVAEPGLELKQNAIVTELMILKL